MSTKNKKSLNPAQLYNQKLVSEKTRVDDKARAENENDPYDYDGEIEKFITETLREDRTARAKIARCVLWFVGINFVCFQLFLWYEISIALPSERLSDTLISDYIKYGMGLSSILLALVGFWFRLSKNLITEVMKEKIAKIAKRKDKSASWTKSDFLEFS